MQSARAVLGMIVSYALGIGTIVLALKLFGVRPGNFADWAVSPSGLVILGLVAVAVVWGILRWRRLR